MQTATETINPTDARKQRGAELAKRVRITRKAPGIYTVPASAGPGSYIVEPAKQSCSCPDYELRTIRCKHQWAVEFSTRSETMADGSTKTVQTLKVTYSQEW